MAGSAIDAKPKLAEDIKNMTERQEKQLKDFGNRAISNHIDLAYVGELFNIIMAHWDCFEGIFGKDKAYWDTRRKLLSKVRNYYAHNTEECIPDSEVYTARLYCEEILHVATSVE